MTRNILLKVAVMTIYAVAGVGASPAYPQSSSTAQITVLYDAFGKTSAMKKDWGFSALIEYGGKRILFDTGNNADIFAHNVDAKGIGLRGCLTSPRRPHQRAKSPVEGQSGRKNLCAAGKLWGVRRGFARHLLQAQRVPSF